MTSHYDYRYADTEDNSGHSTPAWVVGLIAGAALGGGLALLFAPRQGTYTRNQLAERGQQAGRQLRQAYDSVAGTARRNARRLTEQAQDWRRSRLDDFVSTASDPMPAGEHHSADSSRVMSPAPSEPRSPFA
ncbi:Gas vesicle protein [Luteitalea pratensis]|uniref:Gas vesicle protein n=1 Tax=Luteitalea pratensis TaxID=1855912 RepID=A0A143PTK0_LUTPR|nr:YtxH domain-containing protein [Luteitalea pratensis]AMY11912.1 Gas vesicle protein [Luteitalea pratensis]